MAPLEKTFAETQAALSRGPLARLGGAIAYGVPILAFGSVGLVVAASVVQHQGALNAEAEKVLATVCLAVALILGWGLWYELRHDVARRWRDDARTGELDVLTIEARAGVRLLELEGASVPHVLLDLGDGDILYLTGSYLAASVGRGAFPSTEAELVRFPRSRHVLSFEARGEPFAASSPAAPLRAEPPTLGARLPDGSLFQGALGTVREEILRGAVRC